LGTQSLQEPARREPVRQSGASDVSQHKSAFAVEAYKDATREPYSYLFVDLRPEQDEDLRLRTNVFPDETGYVYVPK